MLELLKSLFGFALGRMNEARDDRLRKEKNAWDSLDRHLKILDDPAREAYLSLTTISPETVLEEATDKDYPFVERISRIPTGAKNGLRRAIYRKEKNTGGKAWAKCREYMECWERCMAMFPNSNPELPYIYQKFEKTYFVLQDVVERKARELSKS